MKAIIRESTLMNLSVGESVLSALHMANKTANYPLQSTLQSYLEKDKVHIASSDNFIILDHECAKTFFKNIQRLYKFIHLWRFQVCIFRFLS